MANPESLLYSKTHEWVHVQQDNDGLKVATVGISAFAVEALTDLVYIELPDAGRTLAAGEMFGEVESVKAVSDLYAPVLGEVIEVNSDLADQLEILSEDPYEKGWMIKVAMTDDTELAALMEHDAYAKQCAEAGD